MTRVPGIGLRVAGALLLAAVVMGAATARAYYAGGGKKPENDCLIGYEFVDPDQVTDAGTKKQAFVCVDCDPSCDLDGVNTPNGSCTMAAGVCINQSGVTGCTPPSALDKATAKGNVKGVKGAAGKVVIDTSQLLQGSACGAMVDVLLPLKDTKKGLQERKATIKLSALVKKNKSEDISKRKDKDKLTYICQPRPAGEACPVATTTTTSSTTATTAESTTTSSSTVTSSTSTITTSTSTITTSTSTVTTSTSTTSTTAVSTTSTTATTAPTTSTTSTTLVSTTSTTVVTTTSTTTTTINLCGNGMIDPGEECDGSDFGDATCPGSTTGAFLVCTPECTIDYSNCPPVVSTTSTTPPTSSTSTSSTVQTTSTSTTMETTSTSTTVETTSTSTTMESTTTSTSTPPPTSTTTTIPPPTVLSFVTGAPGGPCGTANDGGPSGTVLKTLTCGGLNIGAGGSLTPEGPTPGGAETQFKISGGPLYTLSARTSAESGSNNNCSDTGCNFGTWLPISAALSTCVRNTFSAPASGTLDSTTGDLSAGVPLDSAVYLTNNGIQPCPLCVGGTVGMTNSGTCDPAWIDAGAFTSPNAGDPCTPTDGAGHSYECGPRPEDLTGNIPVDLTPLTTGTASKSDAGGIFCPAQTVPGAFGLNAVDYIEETGSAAGPVTSTPAAATLASVFCIPSTGNAGIDVVASLPGPGATSLPGTLALLP